MKLGIKWLCAGMVLAGFGWGAAAHGNLILNPSFEDGTGQGTGLDSDPAPVIDNWTYWGADGWWTDEAAHDGTYSIKRWGTGLGIYQDFSADADVEYAFSLWAFDNSGEAMGAQSYLELRVEWFDGDPALGGSQVGSESIGTFYGATATDTWTELSGLATAPSGTQVGRFLAVTEDDGAWSGAVLFDSASVVPEPGTFIMLIMGGLGIALLRNRRKL